MWTQTLLFATALNVAVAQIPSLGWCPDYQPMANFDMNRFLGQWHEAERYFAVTELGSRCVTTDYEKMPDGRVWVSNEIRSSFTGVKRVVEGQLQVVGRDGEGRLSVKYTSLPVPFEGQYTILDTDYKSYAVMWSCSGLGPINTQSAWVLTRERLAPGLVLQRAYGVLDKFKISRAFFVKTNQEDCSIQPAPIEAIDPMTPEVQAVEDEVKGSGKQAEGATVDEQPQKVNEPEKAKTPLPVPELIQSSADSVTKDEAKPAESIVKSEIVENSPKVDSSSTEEKPENDAKSVEEKHSEHPEKIEKQPMKKFDAKKADKRPENKPVEKTEP